MSYFNHKSSLEDLANSSTSTSTTTTTNNFFFFFFFFFYNNTNNNSCWCVMDTWPTHGPLPIAHGVFVCTPWEKSTAALMDCPVLPPPHPTHIPCLTHLFGKTPFLPRQPIKIYHLFCTSPYQCWLAIENPRILF